MAYAPAVLDAYVSVRRTAARQETPDQRSAPRSCSWRPAGGSQYAVAIISMLALRSGRRPDQVQALLADRAVGRGSLTH
jgi:hypothetical protein